MAYNISEILLSISTEIPVPLVKNVTASTKFVQTMPLYPVCLYTVKGVNKYELKSLVASK